MAEQVFLDDLSEYRLPVHLVVDGARVMNIGGRDIERRITAHDLRGRPLFRETADRDAVLAGPWLISLGVNRSELESGLAIAAEVGKGVLWLGEPDTEMLFRHLRKLAAARLPDGQILYFRYYDSDVLAAIVPIANGEQAARLFGSTQVIGLVGGTGDGRTVERPEGLPDAPPGPMMFEPWQIDALDERQRMLSRRKIARILRRDYPHEINHLSDIELSKSIHFYEADAEALHLTSEAAIGNWVILNIETNGRASQSSVLRRDIMSVLPADADDAFLQMIEIHRRSLRD